ncbi:uncharacterized protein LOC143258432 [Tachypleus tridentatus]|uniref:uncharacterized protein LOC143258432 n=1 Tax=Tachypleus tridentatus TaxID=6853 RepID=UPI003FD47EEE
MELRGRLWIWLMCVMVTTGSELYGSDRSCQANRLHTCMTAFVSLSSGFDLVLPTTGEAIQKTCENASRGLDCIDDYVEECFSRGHWRAYRIVVSGAKGIIDELCDSSGNSTLRTDLQFLHTCLQSTNTTMSSEDVCAHHLKYGLLKLKKNTQAFSMLQGWINSCCPFMKYVECKSEGITVKCGKKSGEVIHSFIWSLAGPLFEVHCNVEDPCSSAGLVTKHKVTAIYIYFLLFPCLIISKPY